jgi:outer membrane protein
MKTLKILAALIFPVLLQAQPVMTLRSAIDSSLKNNFDIRIARNTVEIRSLYNTYGEAGGLPDVNITGSAANAPGNTLIQRNSDGEESTVNNVRTGNVIGGLAASMTLFNGFKVLATKERLKLLENQSQVFLNQQIQNTVAAVMVKYYDIIRQETYLGIVRKSKDIADQKFKVISQRRTVGMANDADVLQAQIDVNLIGQNIKNQELILAQAKTDLLELLGVKSFFSFDVRDTILIDQSIQVDSTLNFLYRNPNYVSAGQQVKINEQIVKEISAQRYPALRISTAYNYTSYLSSVSQVELSQTFGPTVGLTLQIPVFNGFETRNHRKAAQYSVQNAKLEQESLMNSLTADALKTFQSYSNTLQQIADQKKNYELSGKLVFLMMERFAQNQATVLDMKAAQESYERSGYLLVNLQFAAKVSEIELKLLTFSLGKGGEF